MADEVKVDDDPGALMREGFEALLVMMERHAQRLAVLEEVTHGKLVEIDAHLISLRGDLRELRARVMGSSGE